MKFSTWMVAPVLVLALQNFAQADVVCVEDTKNPVKKEVVIEDIADIRNHVRYGLEYDYVLKVRVQINEIKNGKKTLLKTFEAVSTMEDVNYDIDAESKNGFRMWRYLDEPNQDGFSIKSADGKKITYRLQCEDSI